MNESGAVAVIAAAWAAVRITQLGLAYRKSQRDAERKSATEIAVKAATR